MKISAVTCHLCSSATSLGDAVGSAIIRVETDEGICGHGEPLMGMFCGEAALALVNYYAPLLIGRNPLDRASIWQRMFDSSVWWGRSGPTVSVMGAIANALWDIEGKLAGKPCHQLLRENGPAEMPVYASLGPSPQAVEVAELVERLQGRGFRAAKIGPYFRQGGGIAGPRGAALLATMEPVLAAMRESGGVDFGLIVDGHMGGVPDPFTREEALELAKLLERYGCLFFEEPLSYMDPEGYAWLRQRTQVRIAGGESLCLRREFEQFVNLGALDVLQPDANFVGGVDNFMAVAALAGEHGLPVIPHAWTAGPGVMANLHLAFAATQTEMLEMGQHLTELQRATMLDPPRIQAGRLLAPTAPGLGIEFDPRLTEKFPYPAGIAERASGLMKA
ncbi:MAG: mandelate racemase/muconate lactonizing enzyme family protein [Opitutaceae bacterium]|nr:mandelate racemase/muconate lactonizing enzyme family protein [Opitutaceae bacterium]MBP9912068.1 mandelate racemase/muconate lactonizing enzyme family protein [Opitutaceae bacterium]